MAARSGVRWAQERLEGGPVCPEGFEYLLEWAYALHGRSGVGMGGVAPLSHGELDAWARWAGETPEPCEVEALMLLDSILSAPGEPEAE